MVVIMEFADIRRGIRWQGGTSRLRDFDLAFAQHSREGHPLVNMVRSEHLSSTGTENCFLHAHASKTEESVGSTGTLQSVMILCLHPLASWAYRQQGAGASSLSCSFSKQLVWVSAASSTCGR